MSLVLEPTSVRSRDWSPPLKKTPVAAVSSSVASAPSASARPCSLSSLVRSTPSLRNTCSYSVRTSSGLPVAVVTSTIRASAPPLSSTNRSSSPVPQHRSSAPPMISSRPGCGRPSGDSPTGRRLTCCRLSGDRPSGAVPRCCLPAAGSATASLPAAGWPAASGSPSPASSTFTKRCYPEYSSVNQK